MEKNREKYKIENIRLYKSIGSRYFQIQRVTAQLYLSPQFYSLI